MALNISTNTAAHRAGATHSPLINLGYKGRLIEFPAGKGSARQWKTLAV